jgi:hypothetical protein
MSGVVIVGQAAIGEVCAGMHKSTLCSAMAPSIGDFERGFTRSERELQLLSAFRGATLPQNCWNPANVGLRARLDRRGAADRAPVEPRDGR